MQFSLNNRLDIFDKKSKWLEATVVHIYCLEGKQVGIKVKFKGFTTLWDENHNIEGEQSWKIQPVGTFSKAHGWAKDDKQFQAKARDSLPQKPVEPRQLSEQVKIDWKQKEDDFRAELATKRNLRIVEMNADGNCLFNAISHQMYGTQDFHQLVRQKCMEYILAQKTYFQAFITDDETIEQYC